MNNLLRLTRTSKVGNTTWSDVFGYTPVAKYEVGRCIGIFKAELTPFFTAQMDIRVSQVPRFVTGFEKIGKGFTLSTNEQSTQIKVDEKEIMDFEDNGRIVKLTRFPLPVQLTIDTDKVVSFCFLGFTSEDSRILYEYQGQVLIEGLEFEYVKLKEVAAGKIDGINSLRLKQKYRDTNPFNVTAVQHEVVDVFKVGKGDPPDFKFQGTSKVESDENKAPPKQRNEVKGRKELIQDKEVVQVMKGNFDRAKTPDKKVIDLKDLTVKGYMEVNSLAKVEGYLQSKRDREIEGMMSDGRRTKEKKT